MKKLVFSLAAVAMAAVASVNVYNVNANAVEMSDLQKENVEALAGGEKKTPTPCNVTEHAMKKRSTIIRAACREYGTLLVFCQRGGKAICRPISCQHIYD